MAYQTIKGQICNTGDKRDIPLLTDSENQGGISYDKGYGAITSQNKDLGGIPADRLTLNQLFYITSSNLFEFQSGNFPTFNANALQYMTDNGYPLNAILWCEAEKRFVKSAIPANDDNFISDPTVIGSSWVFLNDDEVSSFSTGLTLTNSATSISVNAGFTKSVTSGRILKVNNTLTNLWSLIQTNSSLTPSANTTYNLYLAYNPSTLDYIILASANNVYAPSLPSGYTDYALLGYMKTNNDIGVLETYPHTDLNDWYLLGKMYELFNMKADTDLNNINASESAKETIVGWGMPDYESAIAITLPYTAPKDGYILRNILDNSYLHINLTSSLKSFAGATNHNNSVMLPIYKGQQVTFDSSYGTWYLYFIPVKGE